MKLALLRPRSIIYAVGALLVLAVLALLIKMRGRLPEFFGQFAGALVKGLAATAAALLAFRWLLVRLGLAALGWWLVPLAAAALLLRTGSYNLVAGAVGAGLPRARAPEGAFRYSVCADPGNWTCDTINGRMVCTCVDWPRA